MNAAARDTDVYRKKTASPAGCVQPSQAGTKLDRTQTAAGLLRFGMHSYLDLLAGLKKTALAIHANVHDHCIGARGVSGTAVTAGC